MISVKEALAIIAENCPKYGVVSCDLNQALGRVLEGDVRAALTVPPFHASAMDGYAVKFSEAQKGARLTVMGESKAGQGFDGVVTEGSAVRIFTGAPLPKGADHVVIQEDVSRSESHIIIECVQTQPRHIRKAGIDFSKGDIIIRSGTRLTPRHIAMAAAANHNELTVQNRPKVAIIASGDELREAGSALKSHEIVNSNGPALFALITEWGGDAMALPIAADTTESICALIGQAKEADIIVAIGGASVGDYDVMKTAFAEAGYIPKFSKVAVKPGKPTWFGTLGSQCVLGLPGNPASAYVCAHLFLKLLICPGYQHKFIQASLTQDLRANGPRETYLRAEAFIENGQVKVTPFPRQDSSLISPLSRANVLIKMPANDGPWSEYDIVDILPFGNNLLSFLRI